MSWFGWGAKPKTDKDLMEKEMNNEDKKYLAIMENHFSKAGYEKELKQLYPDTMQRFVQGYAHCAAREKVTKEKIEHFLNVYRKYNFDTILDNVDESEKELSNAWPMFCYGYDKYGHPVYYDCVGDSKEDAISKVFGIKDVNDEKQYAKLMNYKYTFMKRLHNCKRVQSDKHGKLIYKHIIIFDVKNVKFSYSEFTGMKSQFAKKVIGSDQDTFPDTLYRLFIINASVGFRALWSILKQFADPITAEKIQVLGSDYMKYLTKQIEIDQIPPRYGGKGKWQIKNGFVADLPDDHYPMRTNDSKNDNKNDNNKSNNNDDDSKETELNNSSTKPPTASDNNGKASTMNNEAGIMASASTRAP